MCVCVCVCVCTVKGQYNTSANFDWAYNPGDGDGWPVDLAHVEPLQDYFVEGGIGAPG